MLNMGGALQSHHRRVGRISIENVPGTAFLYLQISFRTTTLLRMALLGGLLGICENNCLVSIISIF